MSLSENDLFNSAAVAVVVNKKAVYYKRAIAFTFLDYLSLCYMILTSPLFPFLKCNSRFVLS